MKKLLLVDPNSQTVFDLSETTLYLVNPEDSPEFITQKEIDDFIKKYPDAIGQPINLQTMIDYLEFLFPGC